MTDIIVLNVSGAQYRTTRATLMRIPSWFNDAMISNQRLDEHQSLFIDRSPKHFETILNFVRDSDVVLPDDQQHVREILKEAYHYRLTDLIALCNSHLKIPIIESDVKMLQIIARPPRPVLILHFGKVEDLGVIFSPPNTFSQFENHFRRWLDIYLKKNTTPDTESWSYSIHKTTTNAYTVETFGSKFFYVKMTEAVCKFIDTLLR